MSEIDLLAEPTLCWCGRTPQECLGRGGCEWAQALEQVNRQRDASERALRDARAEVDWLRRRLSRLPTQRFGLVDYVPLPNLLDALREGGPR